MKIQCEKKELESIENAYVSLVPYKTLIFDGKTQYIDEFKEKLYTFNKLVFELERKYDLINSKIYFKESIIVGENMPEQIFEFKDNEFCDIIKNLYMYKNLMKDWTKNDKIEFTFLSEKTIEYSILIENIFIKFDIYRFGSVFWNYKYDKNAVSIMRKK